MEKILRLLQVEDSESDAALVVRLLERAGYTVEARRVEEAGAMRRALAEQTFDVVVADHRMGQFDAPGALAILRESGLDIPFLVVSGSIQQELAISLMKAGAHDYLLKSNLARLVPAVEREIREAHMRRERNEAEQRLALAINATQLGTFDYRSQSGALILSDLARKHAGLSADSPATYDTLLAAVHPEDRSNFAARIEDALRPGSEGIYSAEFRTSGMEDGETRWISSWGRAFLDAGGQAERLIGVMLDITARKTAELEQERLREQLLQAQKLESVGRLAGGIAHDFNNLLTVITGYASMLLAESPGASMQSGLTEIALAGERAAALSQQLLVLSRKSITQQRNVDVNDIVREVRKMLYQVIGEDVTIETKLEAAAQWVFADPGQLHQVLMNLAVNARDAMPHGGTIRVETSGVTLDRPGDETRPGNYVRLTVSDTGYGMTPEVKKHIFEPFFTTKPQGEGTGLGLAIVYGIVKQSGGAVEVQTAPGAGTTFRILLPRVEPAAAVKQSSATKTVASGNETVLVVEDQEQVRKLTVRLLKACGYKVLEAADASAAMQHAMKPGEIHLLLTDIVMPGMSGVDLAEQLRELRPSLRIVYMSGYSERVAADRLVIGPDKGYLTKPFSPQALAAKVREVLDRPQSREKRGEE